jgi:hypothetical protein
VTRRHKLGAFSLALIASAALLSARQISAGETREGRPAPLSPSVPAIGSPSLPQPDALAIDLGGKPVNKPLVQPKPLSDSVQSGLRWLAENQLEDGSWGQGEESAAMGGSDGAAYQGNVADSCIAILALYRAGSTPTTGPYKDQLARGVNYVLGSIEASDNDSLYVTGVRGTRVQSKIGTYVDTFLANLMLAELKGHMGSAEANKRLDAALHKVITKIENHQGQGGSWDNQGWAPVLTQSIAAKGLNRARLVGAEVKDETLDRAQKYAEAQLDPATGEVRAEGSAGVSLYAVASNTAALQERANTNEREEQIYREKVRTAPTDDERAAAQARLDQIARERKTSEEANLATVARLKDPSFVSGFGSNGGEEFLSYMNISEALVVKGGQEWKDWDEAMSENLSRVQNPDGSWSGHHCITGKTFCTASALLVLTADRMTLPVAQR